MDEGEKMKKVNKLASVMIGNWVCDACLTNAKRKILLGNGSTFFHQGPDLSLNLRSPPLRYIVVMDSKTNLAA